MSDNRENDSIEQRFEAELMGRAFNLHIWSGYERSPEWSNTITIEYTILFEGNRETVIYERFYLDNCRSCGQARPSKEIFDTLKSVATEIKNHIHKLIESGGDFNVLDSDCEAISSKYKDYKKLFTEAFSGTADREEKRLKNEKSI